MLPIESNTFSGQSETQKESELQQVAQVLGVSYTGWDELSGYIDRKFPPLDESEPYFRLTRRRTTGETGILLGNESTEKVIVLRFRTGSGSDLAPYRMILGRARMNNRISEAGEQEILDQIAQILSPKTKNLTRVASQLSPDNEKPIVIAAEDQLRDARERLEAAQVARVETPLKPMTLVERHVSQERRRALRQQSAAINEPPKHKGKGIARSLREYATIVTEKGDILLGGFTALYYGFSLASEWVTEWAGFTLNTTDMRNVMLGVTILVVGGRRIALPLWKRFHTSK